MGNNRKCTCIIPGCKLNGEMLYAEIENIRKHLQKKHAHYELVNFAFEKDLIPSKEGYISHSWIVNEIAQLCLILES